MRLIRIWPALLLALTLPSLPAAAQTSIALSAYGAFSGTTTGHGTTQSPSNAAGVMFELRHISNPILGFEATYSYNRANEAYSQTSPPSCPINVQCAQIPVSVPANAHEVTLDWTPSLSIANLRPFGVLGVGALFDVPTGGLSNTGTVARAVYVYGAGLDLGILPHIGLRFQYRGNLYKAPDLSTLYSSTGAFTHTSEPMLGIYFNL